ncbi:4'-phosphopantetheinyl transferase family protein [Maritalea myrionectae]|uniref:4'-phosphopantetheinyl transferase family protein n=1 Tax=Maritalea myrionectae TaxID=454601 RepID=UPI00041BDB86|nr:4'-phosphopantetheinyl transferase superfamily protein [Maritalea myrionectae]
MPLYDQLEACRSQIQNALEADQAAVFYAPLDALNEFSPLITPDEAARFDRVWVPAQRKAHIWGRTLVRYFLKLPTDDFDLTENGKPISNVAQFNISHTQHVVAVAFHQEHPVGVDIETISRKKEADSLIDMVCHANEKAWIGRLEPAEQGPGFMRMWVRKEALLKVTAMGLIDELNSIDVRLNTHNPTIEFSGSFRLLDFDDHNAEIIGCLATNSAVKSWVLTCLNSKELLGLS